MLRAGLWPLHAISITVEWLKGPTFIGEPLKVGRLSLIYAGV